VLVGRANWWFPRWLDRIVPNFSIEGEQWFRDRDAATAAAEEKPVPVAAQ
jgi:putative drug exporter of the RND superfamily